MALKTVLFNIFLLLTGLFALFGIVLMKAQGISEFTYYSPLYIYTVALSIFQLSRLSGAIMFSQSKKYLKKRALELTPGKYEPKVSFVIPCKDEEDAIGNTVEKCFSAKYPSSKIEVIVINDGSTDGTIKVLRKMKQKYGKRLVVINWKKNRGKREGMGAGFKVATGEIVVQLDSDSYIEPSTFRNLIEPFRDPQIGGVCAHADPQNADTNWLTRAQAAYYFTAFRIQKAAESTFMTVFCLSGCSSAYRKSIIDPILDDWLKEQFLGLPLNWGDDRSLTNRVLREGYKTIYTDDVQAYTICPDKFKKFIKQQIRWKKGWFVNSVIASRFILKKDPFVALTYFFPLIAITILTPFMALRALIYYPIVTHRFPIFYVLGIFVVAILWTSYYRFLNRENKYWPYLFVWSGLNMIFLSYILVYALATIQNRKWGTR